MASLIRNIARLECMELWLSSLRCLSNTTWLLLNFFFAVPFLPLLQSWILGFVRLHDLDPACSAWSVGTDWPYKPRNCRSKPTEVLPLIRLPLLANAVHHSVGGWYRRQGVHSELQPRKRVSKRHSIPNVWEWKETQTQNWTFFYGSLCLFCLFKSKWNIPEEILNYPGKVNSLKNILCFQNPFPQQMQNLGIKD